jgi:hypothetical protein
MPTISVKKLDASTFEVAVQGAPSTTHIVTVPPHYAGRLTGGKGVCRSAGQPFVRLPA